MIEPGDWEIGSVGRFLPVQFGVTNHTAADA